MEYSSSKSKLKNHNIPILEELSDPHDSDHLILVLPLLREFDDPKFETVGEAVGCLRQVLEVSIARDHNGLHLELNPRPGRAVYASGSRDTSVSSFFWSYIHTRL